MWRSYTICAGRDRLNLSGSAGEYGEGHRKNAALPALFQDLAMDVLRARLPAEPV